jgi:uncharacterized protein (TIGR02300 family)
MALAAQFFTKIDYSVRRTIVAKPEWGIKRVCYGCSTKFYDLEKEEIICPSCGDVFDPEAVHGNRREKLAEETKAPEAKAKTELKDEDDLEVEVEDVDIDTNDDTLLVVDDDADETIADVKPFDDSEEV